MTIIKDLLFKTSAENIAEVLFKNELINKEEKDAAIKCYRSLIQDLKSIEPVNTGYVVLGTYIINEFDEEKRVLCDARVYNKEEIMTSDFSNLIIEDINDEIEIPDDKIEAIFESIRLPDSYAIDFMPWPEVLGLEVDEENIKEYGADNILASVLYEITFFGFHEEEIEKEREKLIESIKEAEEMMKLPKEEQDEYFVSAEDIFKDLGYAEEKTERKKEESDKLFRRRMLKNLLWKYEVLKKYKK